MSINPQNQALNQHATALQHQIQNAGGKNSAIYQAVTKLKDRIASNANSGTLNDEMRKINNMIIADQRAPHQSAAPAAAQPGHYQPGHYQSGTVQGGHYQPGHYEPGHFQPGGNMPAQTSAHPMGPNFSQNQNSHMQYGLRQMSAALNIHPKF
jgi:hypothetical protein